MQAIHAGYHQLKLPNTFIPIKYTTVLHPTPPKKVQPCIAVKCRNIYRVKINQYLWPCTPLHTHQRERTSHTITVVIPPRKRSVFRDSERLKVYSRILDLESLVTSSHPSSLSCRSALDMLDRQISCTVYILHTTAILRH